jgi:hypothetical protein
MLPPGPAPEHMAPTSSSASGRSRVGSDRCVENYIRTAKIVRGIPVVTSILRLLAGASSLSRLASTPDSDSSNDYPKIRASAYGEPAKDGRFIYMVTPNSDRSSNTSSRYPTIGRSEASDARTPSGGLVRNLNPDFNAIQVQAIMETIQRMVPDVKLRHQQVQIAVCPSMTRGGTSLRATPPENTAVNEMTSATLLKIGGVSGAEHRPHHDGL